LLFDLGGVVMALDWEHMFESWAASSGTSAAELRRRFSFDEHYQRYERCEIDERAYFASLRQTLDIDIDDAQFETGWGAIFVGEIAETLEIIRGLHGRIPMYAFSNTNLAHHAVWSRKFAHALALFNDVYISCTLGARKPEGEAFARVAHAMKTPQREILFFDDTPENVDGARAAGLQAVLVKSPQDVRDALGRWL
jgi:FMN phosphatase YigB (HAD superfamily)